MLEDVLYTLLEVLRRSVSFQSIPVRTLSHGGHTSLITRHWNIEENYRKRWRSAKESVTVTCTTGNVNVTSNGQVRIVVCSRTIIIGRVFLSFS